MNQVQSRIEAVGKFIRENLGVDKRWIVKFMSLDKAIKDRRIADGTRKMLAMTMRNANIKGNQHCFTCNNPLSTSRHPGLMLLIQPVEAQGGLLTAVCGPCVAAGCIRERAVAE